MKLERIAIWTRHLEELRDFYTRYFDAVSNRKYISDKGECGFFNSCFLSFDGGARVEIMMLPAMLPIIPEDDNRGSYETTGLAHLVLAVATNSKLDALYESLKSDGVPIVGAPCITGDGYYECCVLDPDGNRVKIMVEK
jgi:lactoylglutathione lyase